MMDSGAPVGRQIDQFAIQRSLGSGGMADVYLAWDQANRWPVALKVINAKAMSSSALRERFQREVAIAQQLFNPHLVRVYGSGQAPDGRPYLVMEYIDGGSLSDLMDRFSSEGKAISPEQASYLIRQIAGAMAYAHQHGVIHRDLKPDNILLRSDSGEPVITDLGIARIVGANPLTGTSEMLGTPHYMAPEQVRGAPQPDQRADIYAIGVMLYELLSGQRPFEADSTMTVLYNKLNEKPPALKTLRPGLDPALVAIVEKAMARDLDQRYATSAELVAALDRLLPVAAIPAASSGAAAVRLPTPTGYPVNIQPQRKNRGKVPGWLIGLLVILVVTAGGVALAASLGGGDNEPPATPISNVLVGDLSPQEAVAATVTAALATETAAAVVAGGDVATSTLAPPAEEAADPLTREAEDEPSSTSLEDTPDAQPVTIVVTATPSRTPTTVAPASVSVGQAIGAGSPLDFEAFGAWVRGDEANGTIVQTSAQSRSGRAAQLDYNFETAGNDYVVFLQEHPIDGEPGSLRVWVYGDGSGQYLNAWIRDSDGQSWQVPMGRITHTGWREMTGKIDVDQDWPWAHISGPNNNAVDYPIRLRGIVVDDWPDSFTGKGTVYLDDLEVGAGTVASGGATAGGSTVQAVPGPTVEATPVTPTPAAIPTPELVVMTACDQNSISQFIDFQDVPFRWRFDAQVEGDSYLEVRTGVGQIQSLGRVPASAKQGDGDWLFPINVSLLPDGPGKYNWQVAYMASDATTTLATSSIGCFNFSSSITPAAPATNP